MPELSRVVRGALLLLALSCHRPPKPLVSGLAASSQPPPSSLLRLPAQGGFAQLYLGPSLSEADWKAQSKLPALRRTLGADLDERLVYAVDASNAITALDLETGRARPLAGKVRDAVMGPDGALYAVDDSNGVTQFVRRTPTRFRNRVPGRPREIFGTKDDELLAISTAGNNNTLSRLSSGQPTATVELPGGDVTATPWGELLAVAADSVVMLYEPRGKAAPHAIPVDGHSRAVAFSPSGHRLYIAQRKGPVLVLNRYTDERVGTIELPGPAVSLRMDPYGRWLLVHPAAPDSVWLVDLGTDKFVGSFLTEWNRDLPTVTPQQALVTLGKQDILAYDLSQDKFPQVGRVAGGARDLWISLPWVPSGTPVPVTAAETTVVAGADTASTSKVYLQVSSSQNPAWADELAKQLSSAGLPASVLRPTHPDEGYRVVLGPYPSRDEAEATGKKLGRPFFIYQPERSGAH